jgi:hypothetical protein
MRTFTLPFIDTSSDACNLYLVMVGAGDDVHNRDDALARINDAVTNWILNTQDGDAAWVGSGEGFNLPDLLRLGISRDLNNYLGQNSIFEIRAQGFIEEDLISPVGTICDHALISDTLEERLSESWSEAESASATA